MSDCSHSQFQVFITGVRSFPAQWEPDGMLLITEQDLREISFAQVEILCKLCGEQRVLNDDEWEVA